MYAIGDNDKGGSDANAASEQAGQGEIVQPFTAEVVLEGNRVADSAVPFAEGEDSPRVGGDARPVGRSRQEMCAVYQHRI